MKRVLRRWYWKRIRRYRYEMCQRCGRPVSPRVRNEPLSYWHVEDALWIQVEGSEAGVRCITCFTRDCYEYGIPIWWQAVEQGR